MATDETRSDAISAATANRRSLPKRFYATAVAASEPATGQFHVLLDGRSVKTPRRQTLQVPTLALAEVLAEEWRDQAEFIDPNRMPMTRIVNTALDMLPEQVVAVRDDIVRYAGSDHILYRVDAPAELVERQQRVWEPIVHAVEKRIGARFQRATGIVHATQSAAVLEKFRLAIGEPGALQAAALHVLTTLSGSALLALSVNFGLLEPTAAWSAANLDEDWQIEKWGSDLEAEQRRANQWSEFAAAARAVAYTRQ